MGEPVGNRFGQMLNNMKDWRISFGSHVYRIGLKKIEIGWNLEFPFGKKFPTRKRGLNFRRSVSLRNFSLDRFLVCPLFFSFCCCQLNGHSMSSYDLFKANGDGCENNLVNNKCLHETLTRIVRLMVG